MKIETSLDRWLREYTKGTGEFWFTMERFGKNKARQILLSTVRHNAQSCGVCAARLVSIGQ